MMKRIFIFVFSLVVIVDALTQASHPKLPTDFRLIYSQDFEGENWKNEFAMTDPRAWKWGNFSLDKTEDRTLELFKKSKYQPPHRSPLNMAYLREFVVGDFILDISLLQTGREYGHRDMCLFFGFQDPAHFYYVHLATAVDDHAHNIFIVNDSPRRKISKKTTKGVDWGTGEWHHIRLVRKVSTGLIEVFFDDMKKPIMEASDQTFGGGHLGFGSFDDTGMVDDIKLWSATFESQPIMKFETFSKKDLSKKDETKSD